MPVLKSGTILGDYAIVGLIARGGMGEVYEAHDTKLDRHVALKVITEDTSDHESSDLVKRFMQEARTLAKINHPNVVTVHAIQTVDNVQFIAMEHVEGVSIKEFLVEYNIPIEIALFLFEQILSGLKRLHEHGIVHRDLKPSNILIRVDGQVKILDFGVAKSQDALHNTNPGVTVGTPPYMAPEMRSLRGSTARSDFWSLGAIFFECLTGKMMIDYFDGEQFRFKPSDLKDIPPEMRAIIGGMSAPEPDDRYRNTAEILDDLQRLRQSIGQASPRALTTFRDQLRGLVEAKLTAEKSAMRSVTMPKVDIDIAALGSETMANSIRRYDRTPGARSQQKMPESRSSRRKRQKQNFYRSALMGLLLIGAGYIGMTLNRQGLMIAREAKPLRVVAHTPPPAPPVQQVSSLNVVEPADRQVVWLEPGSGPTFSWSRTIAPGEFDIQIAMDADFKRTVAAAPVSGNTYNAAGLNAEGVYYWRLVPSVNNKHVQPPAPRMFTLARLEAPTLAKPEVGQSIEAVSGDGAITDFEWSCRLGAHSYNAQVASDSAFKKIAASQVVSECRWPGVRLKPGRYFWRVRVDLGPGYRDIWSTMRPFHIVSAPVPLQRRRGERIVELPAPKLKNARQTVLLNRSARNPASKVVEKQVDLSWSPVKGAKMYNLQLAYTMDMSTPFVNEIVSGTSYKWKAMSPGKTFWRVRALNSNGAAGAASAVGQVTAMLPPLSVKTGSGSVEWQPSPMATKYLVQIGTRRDLAGAKEHLTQENRFSVPGTPGGRYFVRVAAADAAGQPSSPFSNVAAVRIPQSVPALRSPKPLSPITGAFAPSRGGRISIEFSWTAIPQAESYSIELASDPRFKNIVERANAGEPKALLEQVEVKGRTYWRVKANGTSHSSAWSEAFYFDVK